MPRLGCVRLRQLPLQILLGARPEWRCLPAVVTKEDKPLSPVLFVNRAAREQGISPGMRYAAALSLVPGLRASTVTTDLLAAARRRIVAALTTCTPDVEPVPFDPEAFWVNTEGLRPLYGSMEDWMASVEKALRAEGFRGRVVIGSSRLAVYVISSSAARSLLLPSPEAEERAFAAARVDALPLSLRTRATLRRLGITGVAAFLALPREQVVRRFGVEARTLFNFASSLGALPVQPVRVEESPVLGRRLDATLTDAALLMEEVTGLLDAACSRAAARGRCIEEVAVTLGTEEGDEIVESIRTAAPTTDARIFYRLVHLRLASLNLSAGVNRIGLRAAEAAPSGKQEELFGAGELGAGAATRVTRDLEAGARAVALLKARWGNDVVVRARLTDSHVPEERFRWDPVDGPSARAPARAVVTASSAGGTAAPAPAPSPAVRRILLTPRPQSVTAAALARSDGPFEVTSRWWGTEGVARDYYFLRTPSGGARWVYYDRAERSWLLQGVVD